MLAADLICAHWVGLARIMRGDVDESAPFPEEASLAANQAVSAYALAELALGHLARGDPALATELAERAC